MKQLYTLILLTALCAFSAIAQTDTNKTLILTPSIYSSGFFPYSGYIVNKNPAADINLFYEKNKFGLFVFKSLDLVDLHSFMNYFQVGLFKRFEVTKTFSLSPYFGYITDEGHGLLDKDQDLWGGLVTKWQITKHVKLANATEIFNLINPVNSADIISRFELTVDCDPITVKGYTWYNIAAFGAYPYLSGAIRVEFPTTALTKNISVQPAVIYHSFLSSYKPLSAIRQGFVFVLAFPIDFIKA